MAATNDGAEAASGAEPAASASQLPAPDRQAHHVRLPGATEPIEVAAPFLQPNQLEGFRIGVTSDRRSSDLIDAFERRGARVVHAPTLRIAHSQQDGPLLDDTRTMIAARPDLLLATTGYGVRRWFEVAEADGIGSELTDALADTTILVRGPKARGGIRATGLNDSGMSDSETTASLVDKVLAEYPPGLTIGIQVHGATDEVQLDRLRAVHQRVLVVAPYRWIAMDDSDARVYKLVEAICSRQLDCVTFTSAPAVHALFTAAEGMDVYPELIAALQTQVCAAAVGPVTSAPLIAAGVAPIQPTRFRMGALVRLVCEHLEQNMVERIETQNGLVQLRGSIVQIGEERVQLPPTALAILRALVRARGAVVSREDLALAGYSDDHAMEVSLSRLRQTLGAPGLVATVVKRGYRLNV
ncbi:uroporphyrinogen-III synthase [Cryobacterium sp. TMS1-13-1]|uniref:uroporphyrinogen-III synthase n=1 Tax=Cryobacterium sp. TMS1-13-1 TaxID=1259220 RepID=UPI0010693AC8|nr:uroporphyrinogen-III synthase [Cryobacterium sp. TMS1-13-1]TFD19135.1 uroporphyrinogen-III synthase [Cryobacterium sp. TMS1-13-1]